MKLRDFFLPRTLAFYVQLFTRTLFSSHALHTLHRSHSRVALCLHTTKVYEYVSVRFDDFLRVFPFLMNYIYISVFKTRV